MSATLILLDRFKEARKLPSDNAASKVLGVTRATVSRWRMGEGHASPHVVLGMCRALGYDDEKAAGWLALVESQRTKIEQDRKAWRVVARKFGAAATLAAAALLTLPAAFAVPDAQAETVGIMRSPMLLALGFFTLLTGSAATIFSRWKATRT